MQYSPSLTTQNGWPPTFEQLRAAVVAVRGVGDQELPVVAQARVEQAAVERLAGRPRIAPVQRGGEDVVQAAEIVRVEVSPFETAGDDALQVAADRQPQHAPLSRWHLDRQARTRAQAVRHGLRQPLLGRPAAEQGGRLDVDGFTAIGADRPGRVRRTGGGSRTRASQGRPTRPAASRAR